MASESKILYQLRLRESSLYYRARKLTLKLFIGCLAFSSAVTLPAIFSAVENLRRASDVRATAIMLGAWFAQIFGLLLLKYLVEAFLDLCDSILDQNRKKEGAEQ